MEIQKSNKFVGLGFPNEYSTLKLVFAVGSWRECSTKML